MKVIRVVLLIAAILAIIVLIVNGADTPRGEAIVGPASDLARGIVGGVRDITPGLSDSTAGDLGASLLIGMGVFVLAVVFIPGVRSDGRVLAGTGIACLLLTFALFAPTVIDQVSSGVGG